MGMQDLENNNWNILDPLWKIYKVYAKLTMITALLKAHSQVWDNFDN